MTENDIKAHKARYGQMDSEYEEDGTGTRKGHGHDYGQTIMSQLNPQQLQASAMDQDLRKKLRIDRIKKRTNRAQELNATGAIEDSREPEWKKARGLRDIEMIRMATKSKTLSEAMGSFEKTHKVVNVVPGQISFEKILLENRTNEIQNYNVSIRDPDSNLIEEEEVQMVHGRAELEHWIKQKQVHRPGGRDWVADKDLVMLPPGTHVELLFKFLTFRDVSSDVGVEATSKVVKERSISIVISTSSGSVIYL
jgi:hypothetical protein